MTEDEDTPERDPLDPFGASAGDAPNDEHTGGSGDDRSSERNDGPGDDPSDDRTADANSPAGDAASAPLDDLAASVSDRGGRTDDGIDGGRFEQQDVDEIDADVVWDRLEGDDAVSAGETSSASERDTRVVAKADFCEQCPYFAPPPEVACSHDGTEILELVDMERFRVVDCPKVRETERLEDL